MGSKTEGKKNAKKKRGTRIDGDPEKRKESQGIGRGGKGAS